MMNLTIDKAIADPQLLGAAMGELQSWQTWRALLKAAFGIKLTREDARAFASVAGDRAAPEHRVRELWCIIGRRSGKSRMAALVASYIAAFIDHSAKLAPGEVGTVLILAASKSQANVVYGYVRAFFEVSPLMAQLVEEITADEIRLRGNIVVAVHTNNYRTVRGRTLLACIFDEVGFWRDETTSLPDVETYRAILPALATTDGMLVGISSPYAQRGLLFTKYRDCYARDNADVLVVQAGTETFNPTINSKTIEQAYVDDPESASAEYGGQFRGDLSTYVDRAVLDACVENTVRERAFQREFTYVAHVDPSGGQNDSMAVAIAHREGDRSVLDVIAEWKAPFSPPDVVQEAVELLKRYRISAITGDAYASNWVRDSFRPYGITYRHSDQNRNELYLSLLPLLTGRMVCLLDHPRLVGQLSQLERRTGRIGRDSIDHMRGAHDDLAVAAAGALCRANKQVGTRGPRHTGEPRQERANMAYEHLKTGRAYGRPSTPSSSRH